MRSKPRILVVDDDRSLVRLAERVLQDEDFDVLTAFDGREGLERAREEKPDLIILDIVMPKMDGYEVCRHLQRDPNTACIPVIFFSVKGEVDEIGKPPVIALKEQTKAFHAGALDFLIKPVTAEELVNRTKALLRLSKLITGSGEKQ